MSLLQNISNSLLPYMDECSTCKTMFIYKYILESYIPLISNIQEDTSRLWLNLHIISESEITRRTDTRPIELFLSNSH